MCNLEQALKLLEDKQFLKAKDILEDLLQHNPEDVDTLYNLGMCYTELGNPEKAIVLLRQCIQYAPNHSNAYVALGVAYGKKNEFSEAKEHLLKAIAINPDNSYALRNLGGILGKLGDNIRALYYLKKAFEVNPHDSLTVYGLGLTYRKLGDMENADNYLKEVLKMKAPSHLEDLAKDELREIAVEQLKSKGFRADAVFYILSALNLFRNKSFGEIQKISFDIGIKGESGLDINNPQRKYEIDSIPGTFSGLQLVCYMYVGFKLIASDMDIGIDLSAEYATALKLSNSEDTQWDWN